MDPVDAAGRCATLAPMARSDASRVVDDSTVDCGTLYAEQRWALLTLLLARPTADLAITVPATPGWTVHDVVSHLVGLAADLNAGCFPAEGGGDDWTERQVASRRRVPLAELAEEWELEAIDFEEGLRLLGHEVGSHFVADLAVHATDVRGALGVPSAPPPEVLAVALDHHLGACAERLEAAGQGSLVVCRDGEERVVGRGPSRARLRASPVDVLQVLSGRRSEAQVRALDWEGDLEAVLPSLSAYPLPAADLPTGTGPAPIGRPG